MRTLCVGILWLVGCALAQNTPLSPMGTDMARVLIQNPELMQSMLKAWPILMKIEPVSKLLDDLASIDGMKDFVVTRYASPELVDVLKGFIVRTFTNSANTTSQLSHGGTRPQAPQNNDLTNRIKMGEQMSNKQLNIPFQSFPNNPISIMQPIPREKLLEQLQRELSQLPQQQQQTPLLQDQTSQSTQQQQSQEPQQQQQQPVNLRSLGANASVFPPPTQYSLTHSLTTPSTSTLPNATVVANAASDAVGAAEQGIEKFSSVIQLIFDLVSMLLFVRFYLCNLHNYIGYCDWPGQDPVTHFIVDMCCWGNGALLFLSNKRKISQWRWPGIGCWCVDEGVTDRSLLIPKDPNAASSVN